MPYLLERYTGSPTIFFGPSRGNFRGHTHVRTSYEAMRVHMGVISRGVDRIHGACCFPKQLTSNNLCPLMTHNWRAVRSVRIRRLRRPSI
jgi:hypothetical protein